MGFSKRRLTEQQRPRYTAYYWDLRGRARSAGTFARKRDADRAWLRAETSIANGRFVDPRAGRQRFETYVTDTWFPHHVIELNTRQGYDHIITKYLLPGLGKMRMNEILPAHLREFFAELHTQGTKPHALSRCKTVLSAIFTTAINDQIVYFHPCTGVTVPTMPKRPLRILTPEEFDRLLTALGDEQWQLLAELALETGLRWAELTELRPRDLHAATRILTISRTVVELHSPGPGGQRFFIKNYPKNAQYRQLRLSQALANRIINHAENRTLGNDDLLFHYANDDTGAASEPRKSIATTPIGHGSLTRYNQGCRCTHCRHSYTRYRAQRRHQGKDQPRTRRTRDTDGHLPRDWFRIQIWNPANDRAGITHRVRVHDLRHTNASWMLAGGADLETVRQRLGHTTLRATENYLHTLPEHDTKALTALHHTRHTRHTA